MGKILERPDAAVGTYSGDEVGRDPARIESLRAPIGDRLQCFRQVRLLDDDAHLGNAAVRGQKLLRRIGGVLQHLPLVANTSLQAGIQRKAVAGQTNCGPQVLLQRQLAVFAGEILERRGLARNGRRQGSRDRGVVDGVSGLVQVHVARRRRGSFLARIDHGFEAVRLTVQQVESAAAETRTRGLDHRQRGRHRHRCVEGVAAGGENFCPASLASG